MKKLSFLLGRIVGFMYATVSMWNMGALNGSTKSPTTPPLPHRTHSSQRTGTDVRSVTPPTAHHTHIVRVQKNNPARFQSVGYNVMTIKGSTFVSGKKTGCIGIGRRVIQAPHLHTPRERMCIYLYTSVFWCTYRVCSFSINNQ